MKLMLLLTQDTGRSNSVQAVYLKLQEYDQANLLKVDDFQLYLKLSNELLTNEL